MKPLTYLLVAIAALTPSALNAGNCHQLYHRQAIVHHHAVVQPVIQQLYFSVGDATRIEAIVEKKLREREAQHGPLQQRAPESVLTAKCARCHSGDEAKGGFDLTNGIDDATFRRVVEMIGEGQDVPDAMKGVIGSLTPTDKGAITSEMLKAKPSGILR